MNTYEKIKILCEKNGFAISSISDKIHGLSVTSASVSGWKNGSVPRPDKIKAIADYFGVSVEYLTNDDAEEENNTKNEIFSFDNIMPITRKRLPLLGNIACGEPVFAREDRDSYVEIGTDINADFCLRCKGDSMIGARIHNGDIVFIRKQSMVDNGEIAAVIIDDEATLKRVYYYKEKGVIILKPENPQFKDIVYTNEELNSVKIIGKAVAFQSDVR